MKVANGKYAKWKRVSITDLSDPPKDPTTVLETSSCRLSLTLCNVSEFQRWDTRLQNSWTFHMIPAGPRGTMVQRLTGWLFWQLANLPRPCPGSVRQWDTQEKWSPGSLTGKRDFRPSDTVKHPKSSIHICLNLIRPVDFELEVAKKINNGEQFPHKCQMMAAIEVGSISDPSWLSWPVVWTGRQAGEIKATCHQSWMASPKPRSSLPCWWELLYHTEQRLVLGVPSGPVFQCKNPKNIPCSSHHGDWTTTVWGTWTLAFSGIQSRSSPCRRAGRRILFSLVLWCHRQEALSPLLTWEWGLLAITKHGYRGTSFSQHPAHSLANHSFNELSSNPRAPSASR